MGALLAKWLGSAIFKAVGVAAIIGFALVSGRYVWLSVKYDDVVADYKATQRELGAVKVDLGIAKAANEANVAELKRLTADYTDFQQRSALTISELAKRHDRAVSDRARLLSEVKNVPPESDPVLSDRARRVSSELRAAHPQAP